MNRALLWTSLSLSLVTLGGCRRGVCDESVVGAHPKLTALPSFWEARKEVMPSSTVVCSADRNPGLYESLTVDFDPQPEQPVVAVISHLEGKGWKTIARKDEGMGYELQLQKEGQKLVVNTLEGHKRTSVTFVWELSR